MATQQINEKLEPGAIVAGKYVVDGSLGEGGFATVYSARHREIPSLRFAVKVLHAEHTFDSRVRGRFRREAETVAALNSRNIVRVIDIGELDGDRPFIVMEFIDGRPLDALLKQCGRLHAGDVARLCMDVLKALDVAHSQNVVHRDLKPANVFAVQEPDEPVAAKVLDFGIAKVVTDAGGTAFGAGTHTVAGNIVCTPQYAAPELLTGKTSALVDIYALGHMMAELLEGKAPYEYLVNPLLIAAEHLRPDPVPLGEHVMASGLAEIVAKACAKPENERFQSAREMLDALRAASKSVAESGERLVLARPYHLAAPAISNAVSTQPDRTTIFSPGGGATAHTPTAAALMAAPGIADEETAFGTLPPRNRSIPWLPISIGGIVLVAGVFVAAQMGGRESPVVEAEIAGAEASTVGSTPTIAPIPAAEPATVTGTQIAADGSGMATPALPTVAAAPTPVEGSVVPTVISDSAAPTVSSSPSEGSAANVNEAAPAQQALPAPDEPRAPAQSPAPRRPARPAARPVQEEPAPTLVAPPRQVAPVPEAPAEPAATTPSAAPNPFGNIELRR